MGNKSTMKLLIIACALSGLVASASAAQCTATIALYPGYIGAYSSAAGTVTVESSGDVPGNTLTLTYALTGLEPSRDQGLHVHTGITCADATYVSGHFFATETDPWTSTNGAIVTADTSGASSGNFGIKDGISYDATVGHAIVVHDASTDTPIGCGICVETQACTAQISMYPGYEAAAGTVAYAAAGTVKVTSTGVDSYLSALDLTYSLTGTGTSTTAQVYMATGVSCGNSDYIGTPYYATSADPWTTNGTVSVGSDSLASGDFSIMAGLKYASVVGHAVVVLAGDTNSSKIGCGVCISDSYDGSSSSSTFAEWAWILIVLVCALGCGAIGYGVAWGLARTNGSSNAHDGLAFTPNQAANNQHERLEGSTEGGNSQPAPPSPTGVQANHHKEGTEPQVPVKNVEEV